MYNEFPLNQIDLNNQATYKSYAGVVSDIPCTVTNSDYKWLSSTLKTSQNGPKYTPYFKCKIINDSVAPNSIVVGQNMPTNSQSVSAPDGSILMVGKDASNNLAFWKITDASLALPSSIIFATSGNYVPYTPSISIACSDWYNGSYVIDVYWYVTLIGGHLSITHNRSFDGGITWTTSYTINDINAPAANNCISAGKPVYDPTTGIMTATVFYIKQTTAFNFYSVFYQRWTGGTSFGSETEWTNSVNTRDLTINDLYSYYFNGSYYIMFSAFHNWIDGITSTNYSLYICRLDSITSSQTTDSWSSIRDVFTSRSSSVLNKNVFTYPSITFDGSMFYIVFKAVVTEGLQSVSSGASQITPVTNNYYYLIKSTDLVNFTYPTPIIFTDGTIFTDQTQICLVPQTSNSYFYLLGNGQNWRFVKNNIVADITNSVISYKIQEMAGASFQLVLVLANANNQWIGPSPTKTGAAAIAVNNKIYVEQGYVTSAGNEIAPRNIFYIDTITLNSTSSDNSATITARDVSRNLKQVSTKFSYVFPGPFGYSDVFDGSTMKNWNQIAGAWSESNGEMLITPGASENIISLAGANNNTESAIIFAMLKFPSVGSTGSFTAIYPVYHDSNNFIQFKFQNDSGTLNSYLNTRVNGVDHILSTSLPSGYLGAVVPVLVRKYNYFLYSMFLGKYGASQDYTYDIFDNNASPAPILLLSGYDVTTYFSSSTFIANGSPAIGIKSSSEQLYFRYFKYLQFNDSLSLQDSLERICAVSGITSFKENLAFFDNQYDVIDYNASTPYQVINGYMAVTPNSIVMNQSYLISNGEIVFRGHVTPINSSLIYGFRIYFRGSNNIPGIAYAMEIDHNVDGSISATMFLYNGGISTVFTPATANPLPLDLTKDHIYRLVLIDQFFYLFVDGRMFLMWQDNNVSFSSIGFSLGYWGLGADSNSRVYMADFKALALWNQVSNVTINPGDDLESTLNTTLENVHAWSFTDQLGRMTGIVLNSTDIANFTYNAGLYLMNAETANQDTINEVVVTGNNVQATYRDPVLIAQLGFVRTKAVIDYTIVTYQAALARAQQELINANKLNNQNTPANPMNVGSEIFDPIDLENTGNNSTNVSGVFRIYNQSMVNDGSKGKYSISIETGTL